MRESAEAARGDFARAATSLATRVLAALDGAPEPGLLTTFVDTAEDPRPALAAVRVLGADALAPHALGRVPLTGDEAATVAEAARVFPSPGPGHAATWVLAWQDWATARLTGGAAIAGPVPEPPPADRPQGTVPAWREWAVAMGGLSALALPGLDGPLHEAARGNALALARGACWATLRRDHALAARLARWLAFLGSRGDAVPLDPAPLVDHIRLLGGVEPRTAVDLEVARRMLGAAGERGLSPAPGGAS
jgi:hypothetical protein